MTSLYDLSAFVLRGSKFRKFSIFFRGEEVVFTKQAAEAAVAGAEEALAGGAELA